MAMVMVMTVDASRIAMIMVMTSEASSMAMVIIMTLGPISMAMVIVITLEASCMLGFQRNLENWKSWRFEFYLSRSRNSLEFAPKCEKTWTNHNI